MCCRQFLRALVKPAFHGRRAPLEDPATRVLVAIEVMSPASARIDRVEKRVAYQKLGVSEYWILDPSSQTLERWRPRDMRPEIIVDQLEWLPDGTTDPFKLDLADLFRDAADQQLRRVRMRLGLSRDTAALLFPAPCKEDGHTAVPLL